MINYEFPNKAEDYVHRIGRTGRAGAKGLAVTFMAAADAKHAGALVKILKESVRGLRRCERPLSSPSSCPEPLIGCDYTADGRASRRPISPKSSARWPSSSAPSRAG